MDEDKNLGAYDNMDSYESSIRPDFYAQNKVTNDENDDEGGARGENASDRAKSALKSGEQAALKKGAELGINALTGGAGGTALKAVEKTGGDKLASSAVSGGAGGLAGSILSGRSGGSGEEGDANITDAKASNMMGMIKKSAPLVAILAITIYGISSFTGQWLFPDGFRNRMREDNNSTTVSTNNRSDALANNVQLVGDEESKYGDVVFNDMGFSEDQIASFAETGITYRGEGGDRALLVGNPNNPSLVVVSDSKVGMVNGEHFAEGDDVASDALSSNVEDQVSIEEKKAQILANLNIAADTGKVVGFTEAMKIWNFKERYITATQSWRGDISGWFNESQEVTQERTATSRDNFKNFELSGRNDENETAFLEIAEKLNSAQEGSDLGNMSLKERVRKIAEESGNENCGASSAAADIEGVLNADQTARQVSASSLMMEAIDKTLAGAGNKAPLTAIMNIFVRAGAADTGGIHDLFGSESIDQHDGNLLATSAQPNIGGSGTANLGAGDEGVIRDCMYEGNTHDQEGEGLIIRIGSMFKRLGGWIKSKWTTFKNWVHNIFGGGGSTVAENVLNKTIKQFEKNKELRYFTGQDTELLGEAMRNATEKMYGEHAKSFGQTTGDEGAVTLTYRAHEEVIAEQAEYDQRTKSPFDVTSQHTFLGSIAYSMIPLAMSSKVTALTSTVGNIGNLFGDAVTSLIPTSSAVAEAGLQWSQGDCMHSNSVIAVANAYCNDYYNTDLTTVSETPVGTFDKVYELRYDEKGYVYGNEESGRETEDADYGDGPINEVEKGLASHWGPKGPAYPGTGEPHGCESDWVSVTTDAFTSPGNFVTYYKYNEPIEWSYSRPTNFEYKGFESGWRNRNKHREAEKEEAVNDEAPGECVLDLKIDKTKQPVINLYGALATFQIASGQRTSEWGVTDDSISERLSKVDFIHGRMHPCSKGITGVKVKEICEYYEEEWGWSGDSNKITESKIMSRWIGGTAYTYYTQNIGSIDIGDSDPEKIDERFKDPTMEDQYFWEENKWYQAYVELLEWMESARLINISSTYDSIARYYDDNPLDNSYEGIIARYSGMSKDRVVAVLDLFQYVAFLADYNPKDLYPLPSPTPEVIQYDNGEIVAQSEQIIQMAAIVYDELRNRAVTV